MLILLLLCAWAAFAYLVGRARARTLSQSAPGRWLSRADEFGQWTALWASIPLLLALVGWLALEPRLVRDVARDSLVESGVDRDSLQSSLSMVNTLLADEVPLQTPSDAVQQAAERAGAARDAVRGTAFAGLAAIALAGFGWALRRIGPLRSARAGVERFTRATLFCCAALAILVTVGIVLSLLFEALRFFARVPALDFFFGTRWSPQTAIRAGQIGSSGAFGAIPVFTGTALITAIAMAVAAPIGLLSAVHLSEYAGARTRALVKPALEVLAGIPTVVYGFFAALQVGPLLRASGEALGLSVASESALAAGLVMGVMIIPFVSSLSDDAMAAVPGALREASLGLGATRSETVLKVVLPAALPGIVAAQLLAISRAIGETMIVVMAAGLAANLTANPLAAVTTVTVQIVTLLVGDQEFDSSKTLAAFALGLTLFALTLGLNALALILARRYRDRYE